MSVIFSEIISGIISKESRISMLWQGSIGLSMSMNMHHLLGEAFLMCTSWLGRSVVGAVWDSGLSTNFTGRLIPQVQVLQTGGDVKWETEISPFNGAAIILVLKIKEATVFCGGDDGGG